MFATIINLYSSDVHPDGHNCLSAGIRQGLGADALSRPWPAETRSPDADLRYRAQSRGIGAVAQSSPGGLMLGAVQRLRTAAAPHRHAAAGVLGHPRFGVEVRRFLVSVIRRYRR
jgi:hypothetical protein